MTNNHQLFERDPKTTEIPNQGVAKLRHPDDERAWKTLKWELSSFVCEGEYARGLERILDSFLRNLGANEQPAAWISGFYGSGKSHLVRVLEYLWRDVTLPTGESARSLTDLPTGIETHLRELSLAGRREGGLWSAAGKLGEGSATSVRLAFLSVVFQAAGLPDQYGQARFVLWLKHNGVYDEVARLLGEQGRSLDRELADLYVSPPLHQAILAAVPHFAPSAAEVSAALQAQYPVNPDPTNTQLLGTFRDVLELQGDKPGKLPLTLVVLDEMQQYLGEDLDKAQEVQHIVEACSAEFDSRVLFVVTGQSALTATPTLQRLADRFPVQVGLSDTDVETVIRRVLLRKRPDKVAEIEAELDRVSGEITRHLGGTRIEPKAADNRELVPDYPLLPSRRRFWERALRALDRAGKAGVLRTQMRVVHEANQAVADASLGHVVGADFIYDAQSANMLASGALLKEIDELIRTLRDGSEDGQLRSRLCACVFLVSQLPHDGGLGDIGLRATPDFLADLLVEDLHGDGDRLRRRVPGLLDQLVEAGTLMRIGDEYRLQTEEGADWAKDYARRRAAIRDDAARMSGLRNEWLARAVDAELVRLTIAHGRSNVQRKVVVSWGQEQPTSPKGEVPVWVRDEWAVTEATARADAAAAGDQDPVVHVLLRKVEADSLKEALASWAAARDTLQQRAIPQAEAGKQAQRAMQTTAEEQESKVTGLVADVLAGAWVLQGGGNQLSGSGLRETVESAARSSIDRLFPRFQTADDPAWDKVIARAGDGAPDALTALGYTGEVPAHPVCREVLDAVSGAGTRGSELYDRFGGSPFGWPEDAVRGAVLVLYAAGHIRAERDGKPYDGPKSLQPKAIAAAILVKEDAPPSQSERFAVRGLLAEAKVDATSGQEGRAIPALLQKALDIAGSAGGPAPLPAPPETGHIAALAALGGNEQFRAVAGAFDQLKEDLLRWRAAAAQREPRLVRWDVLTRFLDHAVGLDVAGDVAAQRDAIVEHRRLLDDPDPVPPMINRLTDELREQVLAASEQLRVHHDAAIAELEASDEWTQLTDADWREIIRSLRLERPAEVDVSTDAELLAELDAAPLGSWHDRIELVRTRAAAARTRAVQKLEPTAVYVAPHHATLKTAADVDAYLNDVRQLVMRHIGNGETVIV